MPTFRSAVAALALAACATATRAPPAAPAAPTAAPSGRNPQLQALLDEHWDDFLARHPEFGSAIGDTRYNDRSQDFSAAAQEAELAATRAFLARFEAIDPAGLGEEDALTRALVVRSLREDVEDAPFQDWKMPVTQFGGLHLMAPELVTKFPYRTAQDYDDVIVRLHRLPRQLADVTANMRLGVAAGLVPPRYLLEKVAEQARRIAGQRPEESPFVEPLSRLPKDIPEATKGRLRTAMLGAVRDEVLPAYERFARFVETEYAPRGRTDAGVWALPDGAARYARDVQRNTTTALQPEEIHALGLREVARIEQEIGALARRLGFADGKALAAAVEADPARHARSEAEMLERYRGYIAGMNAELPRLFGRLPRASIEVKPIEAFRATERAPAEYFPPTLDGSRPGIVYVNTSHPEKRLSVEEEATAYHEGVPGHHMQLAIQQELPEQPMQRRFSFFTAFVEGWALYAERLGKEVGLYRDPYSDYGRLESELFRAVRLVVDTGVHARRWTRAQMVQYFHDHTGIDEPTVQSEVDRYIAWPGQALAYKVGEREILRLRERAQAALGSSFDLRRFHDAVLGAGALPLDVLAARLEAWTAAEARRGAR